MVSLGIRPTRRSFLRTLAGAAAWPAVAPLTALAAAPPVRRARPANVLLLMTDQHRYDAIGCAGNPVVHTPRLDALAASGTVLGAAYCQSPVCGAGRNSILLGRYPHSHGVFLSIHYSDRSLPSFPQVLRGSGYRTACFGKLHVHGRDDLDWDVVESGRRRKPPVGANGVEPLGMTLRGGRPLGQPAPFEDEAHLEWWVKERTIEFLRTNRDAPWFVQCSFGKPHPPFQPPARLWNAVDRDRIVIPHYPEDDLDDANPTGWDMMGTRDLRNPSESDILDAMQGYYGNVAFCDEMFGEVLDELDRLGLRDDTLVLFTGDSGEMLYAHRLWTKLSLFDEAVRVPLVVSWPGRLPEGGARDDTFVEHIDLFPTILEALDLPVPPSVQGVSLLPFLAGERETHRDFARSEYGDKLTMHVDHDFKFIDNGDRVPPELYDRRRDPREITNIASDPQHASYVEEMTATLRGWKTRDVVEHDERTKKQKSER